MNILAFVTITLLRVGLAQAEVQQADVFTSGQGGYHTYRIPAIVITQKGTVLAFCEGRKNSARDNGDIDTLVIRSSDGGKTFSRAAIIWDDGKNTCGNPCPIVDRDTGTIWLLMARNAREVWITQSNDDGQTWSPPVDITSAVMDKTWTWFVAGPGAGIQLKSGRLVAPCDHRTAAKEYNSHVIYSDDHGKTWKIGGTVKPAVNECKVVELSDGRLLLNLRNYDRKFKTRAIATSADGGLTWSAVSHDEALVEPVCQGSLVRMPDAGDAGARFLFANPASTKREKMTVRLSQDDCRSWPRSILLHAGAAAYSDLAVLADGTILCLYERGDKGPYERITLARFRVDDLKP